jgi:hypothetical protein
MEQSDDDSSDSRVSKIRAALWSKQSEMLWKVTYATPLIEAGILAAWYNVRKDCDVEFSQTILSMGIVVMLLLVATLFRMAQYLNALRQAAGSLIPAVPRPSLACPDTASRLPCRL